MTTDVRFGLFTCADAIGHQQLDAWGSWKTMPGCAVSVFGDAPVVADHASRFGFRSIPTVKRDEFGRPSLAWIFARMHDESAESVLGYVNSDIILLPGLAESIAAVRARFDSYLIVARRWNVERLAGIDFDEGWDERVRQEVALKGELSNPYGIDLFVFSRGLLQDVPAFGLGSDYWDNYLVMRARRQGVPVVDVTRQVMLVHQDHSLGTYRSTAERRRGPEGLRSYALAGDSPALLGQTGDATHVVAGGRLTRAETERVTVVIPHSGDPRRLCRCLGALEYQTYPQSFLTAIVVNRDPEAPLRYLEADFPAIRVVGQPWSEPAAARNKGICCATADVVALFDSDVEPAAECLQRAMRVMKDRPECDVIVCRVERQAASGGSSYLERVVGWCDAVLHDTPFDVHDARTWPTGAWLVRKRVFSRSGYFSDLMPGESDLREWIGRAISGGVKVALCRDAVVRRKTVRRLADLKHKRQSVARGDCILESLTRGRECGAAEILRGEWRDLCRRISLLWSNPRLSWPDRAGALLLTAWSSVWTLRAKLEFRHNAWRLVRRRRRGIDRPGPPETGHGVRAGVPAPGTLGFAQLCEEFRQRYVGHPAYLRSLWSADFVRCEVDLESFRADNAYVWQRHFDDATYIRSYEHLLAHLPELLDSCVEDGAFGAHTVETDGRLISRDLLDSVAELGFLMKHLGELTGLSVLDIGAGYGRLAHRVSETITEARYLCVDAIPESTALSRYYLDFRAAESASILTLDEVEMVSHVDLAINVHSFPECPLAAVRWWLNFLAAREVEWLFIVSNEPLEEFGSTEQNGERIPLRPEVEAHGYHLYSSELKYPSGLPPNWWLFQDRYFLFRRARLNGR